MNGEVKIGVYICHCGHNIAGVVDVPEVAKHVHGLDHVTVARDYVYMCSDRGNNLIRQDIKQLGINRVVVAACSPRLHEQTFQGVLRESGLNPYLLQIANIREQCSWLHEPGPMVTEKAKRLVSGAVKRVTYHTPAEGQAVPVFPATLVIGGGIAGIQAALEIANSKHVVYLVEREPSIGGHMAQFDKTFPTLDCSACILTPRMSEVANNPYIRLLTYSEVVDVSGYVGNFNVKIRRKARYVDEEKCIGCGVCQEKCPSITVSEFEAGIGLRKAIYTPFPQAVPNKPVIDKREERPCKAACIDACPVRTNVPGYVKLIAEGRFKEAYQLIRDTNPLPSVCGRVCYAPCEEACNRGQIDEPIAIRQLKMFAADQVNIDELEVPNITKTGKKVAIIGAGPAGLAAAHDLALEGHDVTIFEALPEPGGMLRYAIPEYRLPKENLRKEINYIQRLGVEIRTGVQVGKDVSLAGIRSTHQAVFIATGAPGGMKLGVAGEDLPGVTDGIRFLHAINLGEKMKVGKRVAVIGGGNTAVDCARTAKRLGGEDVRIVYRRSRAEMPASAEEVAAVEKEGIKIDFLTTPTRFLSEDGQLSKMECIRMKLGKPDASGRPRPIPIKGSEFTIPLDTVISALGQVTETEFLQELGVSLGKGGTVEIDPGTGATNIQGVFAGGDVVTGAAYVIDAIAAGKKAACSISRYLKGEPLEAKEEGKKPEKLSEEELTALKDRFPSQKRVEMREAPVAERTRDFREVALGYIPVEAQAEAIRCLAGQVEGCIGCHECEKCCEPKAINFEQKDLFLDLQVGNIIVATGYDVFDPTPISQYGYGRLPNVFTSLEFERLCCPSGPTGGALKLADGREPQSVAIIHCVGSRDHNYHAYCSRVCCMYALKYSHLFKEKTGGDVYQIYIDMRCFGKAYEEFYERVQGEQVNFIRGKLANISSNGTEPGEKEKLFVTCEDTLLGGLVRIPVDMVILCVALEPRHDAGEITKILRLGRSGDGFFLERHPKLDPVATMSEGIFIAGCCQSPKDIPDTVAQASAAAARALAMISRGEMETGAITASINEKICSGCKICNGLCPFEAISFDESGKVSRVNQILCKGCNVCGAACPSGAIATQNFSVTQIMAEIEGVLA